METDFLMGPSINFRDSLVTNRMLMMPKIKIIRVCPKVLDSMNHVNFLSTILRVLIIGICQI